MTYNITFSFGSSGLRIGTDDWQLPDDLNYYPVVDIIGNKQDYIDITPEFDGQTVYTADTQELLIGKMTSNVGGSWYVISNDGIESA